MYTNVRDEQEGLDTRHDHDTTQMYCLTHNVYMYLGGDIMSAFLDTSRYTSFLQITKAPVIRRLKEDVSCLGLTPSQRQ